jgi:hypothetical protein
MLALVENVIGERAKSFVSRLGEGGEEGREKAVREEDGEGKWLGITGVWYGVVETGM